MIHQYKNNGYNIVLDVNSGSVHVVDDIVYDIIALYENSSVDEIADKLKDKYKEEDIREACQEIEELKEEGQLFTEDIYEPYIDSFKDRPTVVKALCLHIAHDCNLACRYCFAEEGEYHGRRALMSFEVGKKALDFLVANSGSRRNLEVDFFGGDKQVTMQLYEDILADANEYGLLVIFHGCTLPRGWERMYPNFASSEAVLASENLHFSQGSCDNEAFNACLHPFIRNTVGSMDFGGSALNKYYNADNAPRGSRRMTSDVFALATAVLFQSPVQHFALAPNNLTDAPEWAIGFMKEVPTTWDEVRFIDGYPGKYVVMARRHGDKWYVAGVNAQKETVKLKIALPMFMPGDQVRVFTDNEELQGNVKQIKVNKKQELQLAIPCNGGILIVE